MKKNDKCKCKCKKYGTCKKGNSWNLSTCICKNNRYLKSIVDDSVIVCNEIINVIDSVPINGTNTISTNVTYYTTKCHEYCAKKF